MTGRRLQHSFLALCLMLLMLVSACSKGNDKPKDAPKDTPAPPKTEQTTPAPAPKVEEKTMVTVHYWRADGNYEDLDFAITGEPKPFKFWQQDKFGIKGVVAIDKNLSEVKFVIRKAGNPLEKEATVPVKAGAAEVWMVAGNDKLFFAEADAVALKPAPKKSTVTIPGDKGVAIHYKRADGNYKGWDLWLWPEGGEGKAYTFDQTDPYGALAIIPMDPAPAKVGYLVRCCNGKWDVKDFGTDRWITTENGKGEIWIVSGREQTFLNEADATVAPADVAAPEIKEEPPKPVVTTPEGKTTITIHYIRPEGDYAGWDLWTWADGVDGKAVAFDQKTAWGVKGTYVLDKPIDKLGFIIRKGGDAWEAKDIDKDRSIEIKDGKAEVWLTAGQEEIATVAPAKPEKSTIVVHYARPDGDYKSWDLWTWADGVDGNAYGFTGTDEYGGVATIVVEKAIDTMGFIVRKGGDAWEAKDPDADRNIIVKDGFAEVWLTSGKADVLTAPPATKTDVTIHYSRPDGNYEGWDLWVWADGIDGQAQKFTATDAYGAKATFTLDKPVEQVSFIVRKGGDAWEAKDIDTDRNVVAVNGKAEAWLISGDAQVLTAAPVLAAKTTLKIHYNRPDGDYTAWDLWVWGTGVDGQAVKFSETDAFGAVATLTVEKAVDSFGFIVRKGGDAWEAKDVDKDRTATPTKGVAEVWIKSGDEKLYMSADEAK